jgi:hypothetical protein
MARPYFRLVPNLEYVSRNADEQNISDYVEVKNLFKRGKLRDDIFGNLSFFTKYQIIGDERPDQVAFKTYNDSTLDWVVLLANNILNIQTEWPLSQVAFDKVMLKKYGSYDTFYNGIHHYETIEVKNENDIVIVPAGLEVPSNYSVTYYDSNLGVQVTKTNIKNPVTNYEYEIKKEDQKRNIYLLKPIYLNIVFNDIDSIMPYKKGGDQYVNSTLKKGDNIKLYD